MSRKYNYTKLLMLVPSMGSGGAERVLATLANGLRIKGFKITILTLTSDKSFYDLHSEIQIIGAGYHINRKNKIFQFLNMVFYGVKSIFFIKKRVNSWEPDIILSFLTHTNILGLIIKMIDKKMPPLIISERADPYKRNILVRLLTKLLYPTADLLVCQSKNIANFFPEKAQNKIRVIPNPINKDSIIQIEPKVRRKVIVGIGRLFPQKNFELLIDSFYEIQNEFPEHHLEIYGEGYLRNKLQDKINNLGLQNKVFLMGRKKNVMNYVYDAQLFVMSSNFEGFPNALIEAMASGLPVISTDFRSGVARDIIKEKNGILVPIGDKPALSNAMRTILSDSRLQMLMSNNNRKLIRKLSEEKIVDQWIKLFDRVLSDG